jgi:hypothetical protein
MNKAKDLSQEDKDLMTKHNIKMETRTVFYSKGYKYDNLKDGQKSGRKLQQMAKMHQHFPLITHWRELSILEKAMTVAVVYRGMHG